VSRDRTAPADWDAVSYDELSDLQLEWGREVLGRLDLDGDETVLDAGCGTGRVTALIAARVARGRVIGVDGSPAMVRKARANLGDDVELIVSDLLELDLADPVDVVFSNAVFHWIGDHDALFERLFAALEPGGRLEAQCGGEGNVAELVEALVEVSDESPYSAYLADRHPWLFPNPQQTRERLQAAGFDSIRCWMEERRIVLEEPERFHRAVGFAAHLDPLPEELHDDFCHAVLSRLEDPAIQDYVRLNISARRPAGG
jgi:trans-aconitate 2-methyltransferase